MLKILMEKKIKFLRENNKYSVRQPPYFFVELYFSVRTRIFGAIDHTIIIKPTNDNY